MVRTTLFDATERKSYERELLAARDRERVARERSSACSASRPRSPRRRRGAIAAAVTGELRRRSARRRRDATAEVGVRRRRRARLALAASPTAAAARLASHALRRRARVPAAVAARPRSRSSARGCYEETRDVAHTLQRSLLAGDPPRDPRFAIATLYQPAVEHLEVGGDWHDAFALPGGRVGIVVGDVVGRGLPRPARWASCAAPCARWRAPASGRRRSSRHLDTFVEQSTASQYATLAYAEVDPATGEVVLAAAGHLPPVLLGARARALPRRPLDAARHHDVAALPRTEATLHARAGRRLRPLHRRAGRAPHRVDRRRPRAPARRDPRAPRRPRRQELVDRAARGRRRASDDVCVLVFRRNLGQAAVSS